MFHWVQTSPIDLNFVLSSLVREELRDKMTGHDDTLSLTISKRDYIFSYIYFSILNAVQLKMSSVGLCISSNEYSMTA